MKPAPFSYEPDAISSLNECDYSIRITLQDARAGNTKRQVRVYADGVYDMFHSGHARQLMQAKNAFPNIYLITGVCNDEDTNRFKGQTVMTEEERYEAVRHCRYVDEVITDAPWSYGLEFLEKHKIDFVAHDDIPYETEDTQDSYKFLKEKDMFLATERTEGISTTDVISRIVKDYDCYLRRNIQRGLSRQDLNISYVKEKSILIQEKYQHLKEKGKHIIDITKRSIIEKWEARANDFIRSFTFLFEKTKFFRNKSIETVDILTPAGSPIQSDDELETCPGVIRFRNA